MIVAPTTEGIKTERKFYDEMCERSFLNKPFHHSDGSLLTSVSMVDEGSYIEVYNVFKIRDCDRTAALSFGWSNESAYENCLYKANIIIEQVTRFRDAMIIAREKQLELTKNK